MMSDNKDNKVITTSKEIRVGGNSVEAEMDEVMNAVDEEMRNTENNPEEEELMVSLDSRSLNNRNRKKLQKRRLSQQLSTTPLKKRGKKWWWPHSQDVFYLSSSVQVQQKEWKKYDSYQSRCQLIITTVESLVQCYASGGWFDQSSERRRTRGLRIWHGRRRLRHHQSS